MTAREYVENGEHLPKELRDFHDQKLFFKFLVWEKLAAAQKKLVEENQIHSASMMGNLDFVTAQVFTVDYFLWFMGLFGYKLQRIRRSEIQFYDLSQTMAEYQEQLMEQQASVLREGLASISAPAQTQPIEGN